MASSACWACTEKLNSSDSWRIILELTAIVDGISESSVSGGIKPLAYAS